MPFFNSIGTEDQLSHVFAKFNTGVEKPLLPLYDAIMVCCTFNFMNRFVEGIGLSVFPEQFPAAGRMLKAGYEQVIAAFGLK